MSDKELEDKIAYFKDQELLDISDDETGFPDEGLLAADRIFADAKAMPPPRLVRKSSSFLGPTPKEKLAEFEEQTRRQRAQAREKELTLVRSETAPEADVSRSFPSAKPRTQSTLEEPKERMKPRRNTSLPNVLSSSRGQDEIPFYKQFGVVPRELKNGKNVKLANNIKLEPEHKQLLRGKIIYFYPNDDVSMPRRTRIHKVIKLGAAWVKAWRDDVTHIMVDDDLHTYSQVLKNINKAGIPHNVVLVKFDPYVPQCIHLNTLLDATAGRFLVKGAPRQTILSATPEPPSSPSSQISLQIKQSRRQLEAEDSQKTDIISVIDSFPPPPPSSDSVESPSIERVQDSFPLGAPDTAIATQPTEESNVPLDSHNDAFSEAVQQAKAFEHLPIDDEDDFESNSSPPTAAGTHDPDSGTDEEPPAPKPKGHKKFLPTTSAGKAKGVNQLTFQCMNPRTTNAAKSGNPNARTIQVLEEMGKYYDQMHDTWRTLSYRRAVGTLRKQTTRISTKEQAEVLPFVGPRLAAKIEEIALTDHLRRLDSTRDDPTDKLLRLFMGVYGAGQSCAYKWIQSGHRTLDDLVKKAKLSDNQKIGIEHYQDFATRIPRAEVEDHGAYVRSALHQIDPGFEVTVMGSYRRGAKDSGDVDMMITKPATSLSTMRTIVFGTLVPKLFASDYLKAALATSHRNDEGTKWHGASCLPSSTIWRRLDLLLVPEEEMGAALIYFTGNDIFNRSMRLLASKKGMRLNQRGLYKDVIRGKNREKLTEGTLIEGRNEKRIFEILDVPWREPTERIC